MNLFEFRRASFLQSVSLLALAFPFFAAPAWATCSNNTPASDETVTCTSAGGVDAKGIQGATADDVIVDFTASGAAIDVAAGRAIELRDGARITSGKETSIVAQKSAAISVGDNAELRIDGEVLGSGIASGTIRAGDGLKAFIGEDAEITGINIFAYGIRGGDLSRIDLSGSIFLTGEVPTFFGGGGSGIDAGDDSEINVLETGYVETDNDVATGVSAGRRAKISIDGTVITYGEFTNFAFLIFADGVTASQGSDITVGENGSVETNGTGAIGVHLSGNVDPYEDKNGSPDDKLGTIDVMGEVNTYGEEAAAIGLSAVVDDFGVGPVGNPKAAVTVRAGAVVASDLFVAISEEQRSDTYRSIDTTLRIAGDVESAEDYASISLAGGNDEVILEPTGSVSGAIFASISDDGVTFDDDPGEVDTFTLDGAAGQVGVFDLTLEDSSKALYGFEIFQQTGGATWTLEGADADIDTFSVLGGVLYVNADMPNTVFPVLSGATLGGTGTIGSFDILAGGRFAPGNSIGTLTATGNGVFAAGSFYDVELNAAGATDLVRLAGTTSIQGGTINVLGIPGTQLYTIVDSAGGVTGQFSAVQDTLPDVDFRGVYNPTTVQLALTAQTSAAGPGFSVKTNALAAAYGGADASLLFVESLTRRLGGISGPDAGTTAAVAPLGYDKVTRTDTLPAVDAIYGADLSQPAPIVELGGLSVFLGAMGEDKSVDDDGGVPGYDAGIGGVLGGLEYTMVGAGRTTFGIAGGYSHTEIDVANGGADLDSGHLGIFASHVQGPLALAGALGYQFGSYDLSRTIGLGAGGTVVASGDADGDAFSGFGEAFYDVGQAYGLGYTIGPVARLRGVTATRDAFVETGAGVLNLSVAEDTISRVYGDIGIRVGTRLTVGDIVLTPQAELRYERTFGDDGDVSFSTIPAAGASFVTAVNDGGRDRIGVGLSMGMEFSTTLAGTVRYDGSFGEGVNAHSGSLALTYKF